MACAHRPTDGFYSEPLADRAVLGIVVSGADSASVAIGDQLRAIEEWRVETDTGRDAASGGGTYWQTDGAVLRTVDDLHLECEGIAAAFDAPDLIAFVSRHSGETGPLLSAHFTGNPGPAEFGGTAGRLATAAPGAVERALSALDDAAPPAYDVSMECTHHGPSTVGAPSLFVELGSEEAQWRDEAGARAVAKATLALRGCQPRPARTVAVLGGGHYAPRATRILRETDWYVGHVAADWALDAAADGEEPIPASVLRQLFERSGATMAVVDGDRPALERAVERAGYRVVSETWLRATAGVPADRVTQLEAALSPVEAGLRFGEHAGTAAGWTLTTLPEELLAACHGADRSRTVALVAQHTVAYETQEAGNRVTGPIALAPDESRYEALIDDFASLLAEHHDEARREQEAIVIKDTEFDPEAAKAKGVPEGPAFGRLAAGEDVTVDGTVVESDSVQIERTRRLPIS
ncbi:MAG: D-aminoacyl-tRNA deacylase [Halobacteriaceae archaeon]